MGSSAGSQEGSLRQEHRNTTRRRIIHAARQVFTKKGYTKATIEDIIAAAGVSRATLYLHFDSKFELMHATAARMAAESDEAATGLAVVLVEGDRADLRAWIESALAYFIRHRPMALAAREAELSEDKPAEGLRKYLEHMEPWVQTWPGEPADRSPHAIRAVPAADAPLHVGDLARPLRRPRASRRPVHRYLVEDAQRTLAWRRSRLSTLPDGVRGSASRNVIAVGP